jgi:hypothetical protein
LERGEAEIQRMTNTFKTLSSIPIIGRLLMSAIFLLRGVGKLAAPAMTIGYIASGGVGMIRRLCLQFVFVMIPAVTSSAQPIPTDYQEVLTTLGKQGDFQDNVLKVNIPRNDVNVTVAGIPTPTPSAAGSR